MKILILSSNNGNGHNAVASALEEAFEADGHQCLTEDALSFISHEYSQFISGFHTFMYRNTPDVFRVVYGMTERNRRSFRHGHIGRAVLDLGIHDLIKYIRNNGFDIVICTHVFAAEILSDAVILGRLNIATGLVETDYTTTPGADASRLDRYFVPMPENKAFLSELGVPMSKITVSGIPVRRSVRQNISKSEARQKLGIAENSRQILMMCGSMGCGPMPELVRELSRTMGKDTELTVICGTNHILYDRLTAEYAGCSKIKIIAYTNDMGLLMSAADVYLTKPGGISVTEAAVKGLPLVLIDTVGGCEKHNLDFFVGRGAALTGSSCSELAAAAVSVAENENLRYSMCSALAGIASYNDTGIIVRAMTSDSNRKNRVVRKRRRSLKRRRRNRQIVSIRRTPVIHF